MPCTTGGKLSVAAKAPQVLYVFPPPLPTVIGLRQAKTPTVPPVDVGRTTESGVLFERQERSQEITLPSTRSV